MSDISIIISNEDSDIQGELIVADGSPYITINLSFDSQRVPDVACALTGWTNGADKNVPALLRQMADAIEENQKET